MSRIIIPGARTATTTRRLVTPQGGWWTGAGSMFFDGVDDLVTGVFPPSLAVANPNLTIVQYSLPSTVGYSMGVAVGKAALGQLAWIGSGTAAPFKVAAGNYGSVITGALVHSGRGWFRQVVTFSASDGKIRLYENGTLTATSGALGWDLTLGNICTIGGIAGYKSRGWKSDVRIYNRILSTKEIADDVLGLWVDATSLLRHWPLESIVGGKTHERVGNTMDNVTGAVIDAARNPWVARTASPTRTAA